MLHRIFYALAIVTFISCGPSRTSQASGVVRPVPDAPESFSSPFATSPDDPECQSRLIDPVGQVELILVQSLGEVGHYLAPPGKYGMAADELLRIECRTGKLIGVVRK